METNLIIRIDIKKMKVDIKAKAETQRFYKNQRKTVHIVGERKICTAEAESKHFLNKQDLRILYAAYGLARGKNFNQIENHYTLEDHPLKKFQKAIDRILQKYEILEEVPVLN